jgi:hypothetical protein
MPPSTDVQIRIFRAAWKHLRAVSLATKNSDLPKSMIVLASSAILSIPFPKEEHNEKNNVEETHQ